MSHRAPVLISSFITTARDSMAQKAAEKPVCPSMQKPKVTVLLFCCHVNVTQLLYSERILLIGVLTRSSENAPFKAEHKTYVKE